MLDVHVKLDGTITRLYVSPGDQVKAGQLIGEITNDELPSQVLQAEGKINEARANRESARQQLRKLELAVTFETRQAQLNLDEAQARRATTGQAVAQAEESVQITKDRYANGLALLTQLLDAETALTAARQRRAAAATDLLIAQATLDHALGKVWKDSK